MHASKVTFQQEPYEPSGVLAGNDMDEPRPAFPATPGPSPTSWLRALLN